MTAYPIPAIPPAELLYMHKARQWEEHQRRQRSLDRDFLTCVACGTAAGRRPRRGDSVVCANCGLVWW